jgi:hypothetical protein
MIATLNLTTLRGAAILSFCVEMAMNENRFLILNPTRPCSVIFDSSQSGLRSLN